MGRLRVHAHVAMCVALLGSTMVFAQPAAAAATATAPHAGQVTAAPRSVNVRALAREALAPGRVAPVRKAPPALAPVAKSSMRAASSAPAPKLASGSRQPLVAAPWPGFAEKVAFAGLVDAATASSPGPVMDPPDPWVAAGPNHVVQSVNTTLRFSTRDGTLISQVSLAAFFAEPLSELGDGDARVLYDAVHARWVASELSFDCATGHVRIAVSTTSDPTLDWTVWDFSFAGLLPDYPGLGLSSDKIVFTANTFTMDAGTCSFGSFAGANVYSFDWADALAGTGATSYSSWTPVVDAFSWRAAANLTSDPTIHLVGEGVGFEVLYGEITGTTAGADLSLVTHDLTAAGIVSPFATPPIPRDPFGPLGPSAVDAFATDALWQAGHFWFVSTYPWTYDAGATYWDVVRITELGTSGGATLLSDILLGDAGFDAYMGGIGLSQVGGLYTVYTESNNSYPAGLVAAFHGPLSQPGEIEGYRLLAAGLAGYKGTRWGDYVGVATDPVDPYGVWQAGEFTNAAGSWSTRVSMLTEDRTPPRTTAPTARITVPGTAALTSVLATVTWSGSDDFTGVARYELQASVAGGAWTPVALATPLSTTFAASIVPATTYRYRVRATDAAGNTGGWATSAVVTPVATPETSAAARYSGTWTLALSSGSYGGRVKYASRAGASVSYTFVGRQVVWMAPKSKTRGSARVYIDGVYRATVSLYSVTTRNRQLVYSYAWAGNGTHTIKLVVAGTAGRPRVDLDAFVILR